MHQFILIFIVVVSFFACKKDTIINNNLPTNTNTDSSICYVTSARIVTQSSIMGFVYGQSSASFTLVYDNQNRLIQYNEIDSGDVMFITYYQNFVTEQLLRNQFVKSNKYYHLDINNVVDSTFEESFSSSGSATYTATKLIYNAIGRQIIATTATGTGIDSVRANNYYTNNLLDSTVIMAYPTNGASSKHTITIDEVYSQYDAKETVPNTTVLITGLQGFHWLPSASLPRTAIHNKLVKRSSFTLEANNERNTTVTIFDYDLDATGRPTQIRANSTIVHINASGTSITYSNSAVLDFVYSCH